MLAAFRLPTGPNVANKQTISNHVVLRSSGFAISTISNTTCVKLPKVISPSKPLQFDVCHCEDSYMPWNLRRECPGSNSYIPYHKDSSPPKNFRFWGWQARVPMKIRKCAPAIWKLKASVTSNPQTGPGASGGGRPGSHENQEACPSNLEAEGK